MGAPKKYTDDHFMALFAQMADGKSLRSICAQDGMPHKKTVFERLAADPELKAKYMLAREMQAEALFDELLDIADDGSNDYHENAKGEIVLNSEHISRSRLRVDTRKWSISKILPNRFGDKLDVTSDGETINAPTHIVLTAPDVDGN